MYYRAVAANPRCLPIGRLVALPDDWSGPKSNCPTVPLYRSICWKHSQAINQEEPSRRLSNGRTIVARGRKSESRMVSHADFDADLRVLAGGANSVRRAIVARRSAAASYLVGTSR